MTTEQKEKLEDLVSDLVDGVMDIFDYEQVCSDGLTEKLNDFLFSELD